LVAGHGACHWEASAVVVVVVVGIWHKTFGKLQAMKSLCFDNSAHWIDAPFVRISVTFAHAAHGCQ
jgi:hypothetical protein